jgi:hypothetical protein
MVTELPIVSIGAQPAVDESSLVVDRADYSTDGRARHAVFG